MNTATLVETIELPELPVARRGKAEPVIQRDLALLNHVSVKLEIVLGQTTLTVKELFALAQGDTLTLDTELDAPVQLQLDGKVIGRGHLVAVGDRFGLRITDLAE
ncbi:FliM/FliN family flagellar motor switch protein [Rhodanobacter sp. KK11]|jgi:flagellar motor switch protein FliN/FliY|uniref:FliM/FliN family flagellar motor switch protein n=1 Tax=Rhodanobacter sp. KK11 TaxID=3083255 RepID=UPI002965DFBA|nr:FliM/FliN family flagellar motor switch protein [Rhodanobacter sp. KK11]MDW2981763.1 FliM/FliN family flagellar motor switch protein [Rhodanobacter sp. KK11]